jgi:hypothetical protein
MVMPIAAGYVLGLAQTFFPPKSLRHSIDSLFRQLYFPTLPMKIFFASFFLPLPAQ